MFKNIQTKAECETDSATQKLKNEVKHKSKTHASKTNNICINL